MAIIPLADIDLTLSPASRLILQQAARRQFAPEAAYRLRLAAEQLSLIQGFEELLSLEAITVEPFPHQIKTAQTVLRRLRGRGLLCDEVGLGKTKEFRKAFVVRGDPRSPKNRGMLRELLADVMVRNTRDQVNIKLPRRRATTIRLHQTPAEEQLYAAVTTFIRMAMADDNLRLGIHRLTLLTLQREIGSCPLAAAPTLAKIARWSALTADQRVAIKTLAA